nr:substrate binding domain-containing protein [Hyphomicrobiales bacterium]
VTEFLETYPGICLKLFLNDSVIDLVEQGLDLAIRIGELAPSTLKARKLAESPRLLVAAPRYLEREGVPEELDDLKSHNCLARDDMRTWTLADPSGVLHEIKISGNFSSTSAEAITEAASSGLGIARKCGWEISNHLAEGTLVAVLDRFTVAPFWNVFAVRSPSHFPSSRVRAFTEFLEAKFKATPTLRAKRFNECPASFSRNHHDGDTR